MTEFKASPARMVGHTVTAILFVVISVFASELGTVTRIVGAVFGLVLLVVVSVMARTRIVVDDDEIAIRRGFGKWFRAAPNTVTVKWTPVFNGIGRGHGWTVSIGRKQRGKEGVTVPLSAWRPATIEALRARLVEVTGSGSVPS